MEPESSQSHSQQSTTGPLLTRTNPVHTLKPYFLKIYLNIIFILSYHLRLHLPNDLFPSYFVTKSAVSDFAHISKNKIENTEKRKNTRRRGS